MADNRQVRDGNDVLFTGATKEQSDGAHAPKIALTDGTGSPAAISPVIKAQLPASLTTAGNLRVALQETAGAQTPLVTAIAQNASVATLLSANSARLGATIYNDATASLLVLLGSPASAINFTLKMAPDSYYEVPFNYLGIITGIWTAAGAGAARCTSLT